MKQLDKINMEQVEYILVVEKCAGRGAPQWNLLIVSNIRKIMTHNHMLEPQAATDQGYNRAHHQPHLCILCNKLGITDAGKLRGGYTHPTQNIIEETKKYTEEFDN